MGPLVASLMKYLDRRTGHRAPPDPGTSVPLA